MSRQHGHNVLTLGINTHHSRVGVFVFDERGDGADTDAHGANEDEGIVVVPMSRNSVAT